MKKLVVTVFLMTVLFGCTQKEQVKPKNTDAMEDHPVSTMIDKTPTK